MDQFGVASRVEFYGRVLVAVVVVKCYLLFSDISERSRWEILRNVEPARLEIVTCL